MISEMRWKLTIASLCLFVCSTALFLFRIGSIPVYVFDEGLYIPAAKAFANSAPNNAVPHPPLGKMMIALGVRLLGDRPAGWRLMAVLFGSITLVALFLWTYLLIRDLSLALMAAMLTLFNNFLYVMSRVAMLDVFYFGFVVLAILALTCALVLPELSATWRRVLVFAAGILFGAATACKWNGLVFLVCVVLIVIWLFARRKYGIRDIGATAIWIGLGIMPVLAYCAAFAVNDLRQGILLSPHQFLSQNLFIWKWHRMAPGNPALNVRWYQWFFRTSPERSLYYLVGNWAVMWTGLPAIVYCAWRFWQSGGNLFAEGTVVVIYAANILQWLIIPQKSTCYYYYYPSAMVLGVAIALALAGSKVRTLFGIRISTLLIAAAACVFLFCYPKMANLQAPYDCALGCWS